MLVVLYWGTFERTRTIGKERHITNKTIINNLIKENEEIIFHWELSKNKNKKIWHFFFLLLQFLQKSVLSIFFLFFMFKTYPLLLFINSVIGLNISSNSLSMPDFFDFFPLLRNNFFDADLESLTWFLAGELFSSDPSFNPSFTNKETNNI